MSAISSGIKEIKNKEGGVRRGEEGDRVWLKVCVWSLGSQDSSFSFTSQG